MRLSTFAEPLRLRRRSYLLRGLTSSDSMTTLGVMKPCMIGLLMFRGFSFKVDYLFICLTIDLTNFFGRARLGVILGGFRRAVFAELIFLEAKRLYDDGSTIPSS